MPARRFERPNAVLFDLDGTLYDQSPLRRTMLVELMRHAARSPRAGRRILRRLRQFRQTRENLRALGDSAPSLEEVQYSEPAAQIGEDPAALRDTVIEWMHRRPLEHLERFAKPKLAATLERLERVGLDLGVFSDYPPSAKLEALGVAGRFPVQLSATDPGINAFKPHPKGFLVGAKALGGGPSDVVYVGDRDDVDAGGADAAGMRCVVIGKAPKLLRENVVYIPRFEDLPDAVGCA